MTEYDPKVIQKFVDRLYAQARSIVLTYTIAGVVVGGAGGYFGSQYLKIGNPIVIAVVGLLLLGAIGFAIGSKRAFVLRLQAQTALCQVKIEENTRNPAVSLGRSAGTPLSV